MLPNLLTMSRIVLAAVIVLLLAHPFRGCYTLSLLLFALAGFTDYWDGYLARKYRLETDFGKLMDPLADKIMVAALFVSFVGIQLQPRLGSLVPAWMVVVILSREFMVTGLRLLAVNKGRIISAGAWGKHKTVWQMLAIGLTLLGLVLRPVADPVADLWLDRAVYLLSLLVVVITLISGWVYFSRHRDLIS